MCAVQGRLLVRLHGVLGGMARRMMLIRRRRRVRIRKCLMLGIELSILLKVLELVIGQVAEYLLSNGCVSSSVSSTWFDVHKACASLRCTTSIAKRLIITKWGTEEW